MMRRLYILCCLISLVVFEAIAANDAVENDYQYRISTDIEFDINELKHFDFTITPELRLDNAYQLSETLFEASADYKLVSFLSFNSTYRLVIRAKKVDHTAFLGTTIKENYGRWSPRLRLRYAVSSEGGDDNIRSDVFRAKASVKYNIPKCKITPTIGGELFQPLAYSYIRKYRYSLVLRRKVVDKQYLSLSYKLDYYTSKNKNKHIYALSYKIEL